MKEKIKTAKEAILSSLTTWSGGTDIFENSVDDNAGSLVAHVRSVPLTKC